MESISSTHRIPVVALAGQTALSYDSLMRWKRRIRNGQDPVCTPGPKKVEPLNLTGLSGATGLSRSAVQFQFEQRLVKLRLIEIGQKREITQKGRGVLGMVESFLA